MKTTNEIAADILAQGAGATEKQAALIARKLARMFSTQARHGVPCSPALYQSWIEGAATKAGASETIGLLLAPQYAVRS